MQRFLKILAAAVLMFVCADARAVIYYVKTVGLDTNNGLAAATPFKTLTKALTVAQAGDTIYVGGGTYTDQPVTVRGGTAAAPITVYGDTLGTFTGTKGTVQFRKTGSLMIDVQHANYVFEKIRVSSSGTGFRIGASASNITFNTCVVTGCTTAVQMLGGSATFNTATITTTTGVIFDTTATAATSGNGTLSVINSKIYACSGTVASVQGYSELLLSRCSIYSNTNSKLMEVTASVNGRSQNLTLSNCLMYKNSGSVQINNSNATVKIFNTTMDQMTASRTLECIAGNVTVQNSIFSNCATALTQSGGSITHTNNIFWNCTTEVSGTPKHSTEFTADPMYTSTSSWIPKTGSPAIDAGVTISGYTVDRAGASRPLGIAYDIGAYEKAGPSSNTPYSQTFESLTTPGTEWSILGTATSASNIFTITTTGATTSKVITPNDNSRTLQVRVNTTVGSDYTLLFDAVFMGSWDGNSTSYGPDRFNVQVNGETMISGTYLMNPVDGNSSTLANWTWPGFPELCRQGAGNYGGSFPTSGAIFRRVRVDFTAENTVTYINFFGSGLQAWSDEAWAVDNVIVALSTSTNITSGARKFEDTARVGGFSVQPRTAGTDSGVKSALLWGDFDQDGHPDALVHGLAAGGGGTAGTGSRIHFFGEGDIGASNVNVGSTTEQSMIADLNNDGSLDLATGTTSRTTTAFNGARGSSSAYTNNFAWLTAAASSSMSSSSFTREAMAVADIDGDGVCDLLQARTSAHQYLKGSISGSQVVYTSMTGADNPFDGFFTEDGHTVSGGDINNDGYPDFFHHGSTGVLMLSNGGTGAYTRRVLATGLTFSDSAFVGSVWGDVDNDGDLDLIIGNRSGGIVALRNESAATSFTSIAPTWGLTATGTVTPALGDYDNDGDLDLFLTSALGQSVLYRNNRAGGSMTFTAVNEGCQTETCGGDAKWVDYNSDGLMDLAHSSESQNYWARVYKNILDEANPADTNLSRYLKVSVVGWGRRGINKAALGTRVELWDSRNRTFLQRRDLGVPSGLGGQEALTAHFGGVSPATTYTVRVICGPRSYSFQATPSACSTTFGAAAFPNWVTFTEPEVGGNLRVLRWREVSAADGG